MRAARPYPMLNLRCNSEVEPSAILDAHFGGSPEKVVPVPRDFVDGRGGIFEFLSLSIPPGYPSRVPGSCSSTPSSSEWRSRSSMYQPISRSVSSVGRYAP